MIYTVLSITLSTIFITLGIIHFNWVFGGKFGFSASLPTKETGERILNPKKYDSAAVGLALTFFGLFYLVKFHIIDLYLPEWILNYGRWIIPSIFLLRAIGEFKYLGFFKSIQHTEFAKMDTKLFSPLCLLIAIVGFVLSTRS